MTGILVMKIYYQLHNDELGYINDCPTFGTKREAEIESANKCRFHSVIEVNETDIKPCKPLTLLAKCLKCPRCAATSHELAELKKQLGL